MRYHQISLTVVASLVGALSSPVCCFNNEAGPSSRRSSAWMRKSEMSKIPIAARQRISTVRDLTLPAVASGGAQHDKGTGTATIPNEIFNLVKSIVGAGVLSLSAGVAEFGNAPSALLPATFLIALMGAISAYTFSIIGRIGALTGATSYAEAWEKTRGTAGAWIIALSSALDCFAGNLTYSMVLADTFKDLLLAIGIGVTRTTALLGLTGTVLLPLCLVKNLSSLAPFSLVGIMGMLYTALAIGIRYFGGAYASPAGKFLTDLPSHLQPSFGITGAMGAVSPKSLILICMLSTAFIAHFNAIKFYKELKNNTLERFNVVVTSSFGISIALYIAVTSMGFLTFGSATAGLVLNNYATKDVLISFSRFAVALSLVFSYPLLFVGTREGVFDLMKIPQEKQTNSLVNKVSVVLVAILTATALKVKDLTFVASMSGAVLGTALIFIFPTLMFRAAVMKMGDKATKMQRFESKVCGGIAALGLAIGGVGAKMALKTLG